MWDLQKFELIWGLVHYAENNRHLISSIETKFQIWGSESSRAATRARIQGVQRRRRRRKSRFGGRGVGGAEESQVRVPQSFKNLFSIIDELKGCIETVGRNPIVITFRFPLSGPTSNVSSTPKRPSAIASRPTQRDASRSMGKEIFF